MTPEDKKIAKCTNCEFYYDNISAASPLGWCRNGYGRAIHTLVLCPKQAARDAQRKERELVKASVAKPMAKPVKPTARKTPKKKTTTPKMPVVIIKAKKTTVGA